MSDDPKQLLSDLCTVEGWIGQEHVFHLMIRDCPLQLRQAKAIFLKSFLHAVLRKHAGNVSLSAKVMGLSRRTLIRMIEQFGIDIQGIRTASRIVSVHERTHNAEAIIPSMSFQD